MDVLFYSTLPAKGTGIRSLQHIEKAIPLSQMIFFKKTGIFLS